MFDWEGGGRAVDGWVRVVLISLVNELEILLCNEVKCSEGRRKDRGMITQAGNGPVDRPWGVGNDERIGVLLRGRDGTGQRI